MRIDGSKYIALAVDIDGEVDLVGDDGKITVLFPSRTVAGLSEIRDQLTNSPLAWLFYFSSQAERGEYISAELVLEYLENK